MLAFLTKNIIFNKIWLFRQDSKIKCLILRCAFLKDRGKLFFLAYILLYGVGLFYILVS